MNSRHWETDREMRRKAIEEIGQGNVIKTVEIDRHHRNGPEIHKISDTGIITIFNKKSNKMITQLIARPAQIKRYFAADEVIPKGLLKLARQHQELALNYLQKKKERKIKMTIREMKMELDRLIKEGYEEAKIICGKDFELGEEVEEIDIAINEKVAIW